MGKQSKKQNKTKKGKKTSSTVNDIKSMIEYHYYDNQPSRTLTLIGSVDSMVTVAEGDTSLTRTGLKITPTSALVRIRTRAGATSVQSALVRYMLVRDKQQISSTIPSTGEVVETYGLRVLSPLSRLFRDRFDVIWDKVQVISPVGQYGDVKYFDKYVSLPANKPVYFNGSAGTTIQKNGLYLLSFTDDGVNSPEMFCEFRMRYADI